MLRWCQSTVRALDGGSSNTLSSIRFRSNSAIRVRPGDGQTRAVSREIVTERSGQTIALPLACDDFEPGRRILVLGGQKERAIGDAHAPVPVESTEVSAGASFPKSSDPLLELKRILTPSASPITPVPARILKRLYHKAKYQAQLGRLTSKQLTQLLSLMGSISLPAPRAPCIYFSKLVSHIDEKSFQTYWPFVLEIVRDKEELGWKLDGTDRYWVMRAQLAKVVVVEGENMRSGDSRLHALSVATEQYLRIRRHTSDPEIHLPYLQALFSLGSADHTTTLARHLCSVLGATPNPHSRFIDLLCHVLLKHGHGLDPDMKRHILSMVHTRLTKFTGVSVPSQKQHSVSSRKIFDVISKRFRRVPLRVSDLRSVLGMTIFPFSSAKGGPVNVQRWAHEQALTTFAPHLSWETQWDNLMLFAISRMPDIPATGFLPAVDRGASVSGVGWRTVFVLATLHDALATMDPTSLLGAQASIRNVVRPLWCMWKAENAGNADIATSIIVASFYHAAASTVDRTLKEECSQYCQDQGLFNARDTNTASDKLQTQDLFIAHILATVSTQRPNWTEIFSIFAPTSATPKVRDETIESLLWHYISRDIEGAMGLYLYSRRNNVNLSVDVIHATSVSLASSGSLERAILFLHHPNFTRIQKESLLGAILRVLQLERRRRIDPTLANRIAEVMWEMYAREAPANQFKYPVRFFFSILIASGHPGRAASLIEAVYRRAPTFFTTRLFLRIIRTLVRNRKLHLAARVFRLTPPSPSRAFDNVRRKFTYILDRAGSHTLARSTYKTGIRHGGWRTSRESLGRLVNFRSRSPAKLQSISLRPMAALKHSNGPTLKYAVSVLVGGRRSLAAYKLFAKSHHLLDEATKSSIGNIILHGPLLRSNVRNGRLVRHVLRTKDLLEKSCAFTPDRVTVNIILKAVLGWKVVFDPPRVKALFDQIIRSGYPASSRWRRQHDVPFGTLPPPPSQTLTLPSLRSAISFERHVRPMYKTFIKAFYLRHDIRAAKMVLGILKEEEALVNDMKESRDRARRSGLVRKQLQARDLVE